MLSFSAEKHQKMLKFIDEVLGKFRSCFSRERTFGWFLIIVIGIIIRSDHLGVTSVMRDLWLGCDYMTLMGFFRSTAWGLDTLMRQWCITVSHNDHLEIVDGRNIFLGDGMKQPKEGRKMPGVKKLHQESENSGKPTYIFGNMFGSIGVLASSRGKNFCIPLAMQIQDGVKTILGWGKEPERQGSHVEEMIQLAITTKNNMGKDGILLLDRYFLTKKALEKATEGEIHIVTMAKRGSVGYEEPVNVIGARGRPRKKGKSVKLSLLFETHGHLFQEKEIEMYGKLTAVQYYCIDLLWGTTLYQKLRFVLSCYEGRQSILVSTDLTLNPVTIIQLYSKRFNIETMFRELHQVVYAFSYRFWSKFMPKLKRTRKKNDPDPIDPITEKKERERIRLALRATEMYVFCCCVAMGLLQMISLRFSNTAEMEKRRYQRTYTTGPWSESAVADYLRKNIFRFMTKHPNLAITRFINRHQIDDFELDSA